MIARTYKEAIREVVKRRKLIEMAAVVGVTKSTLSTSRYTPWRMSKKSALSAYDYLIDAGIIYSCVRVEWLFPNIDEKTTRGKTPERKRVSLPEIEVGSLSELWIDWIDRGWLTVQIIRDLRNGSTSPKIKSQAGIVLANVRLVSPGNRIASSDWVAARPGAVS